MTSDPLYPITDYGMTTHVRGVTEILIVRKGRFWDRPTSDVLRRQVQFREHVFMNGIDQRVQQLMEWIERNIDRIGEERVLRS